MSTLIETSPGLKAFLLEDVFKLLDAERAYHNRIEQSKPRDLLVSEAYLCLTNPKSYHVPTALSDVKTKVYRFRGDYFKPARRVFEELLEELGFELYQDGRAWRIRYVEEGSES